jgi:hypothetical protein
MKREHKYALFKLPNEAQEYKRKRVWDLHALYHSVHNGTLRKDVEPNSFFTKTHIPCLCKGNPTSEFSKMREKRMANGCFPVCLDWTETCEDCLLQNTGTFISITKINIEHSIPSFKDLHMYVSIKKTTNAPKCQLPYEIVSASLQKPHGCIKMVASKRQDTSIKIIISVISLTLFSGALKWHNIIGSHINKGYGKIYTSI